MTLFGTNEPIVRLTALHFTYAGAGTLALAVRLHEVRAGQWRSLALARVSCLSPWVAMVLAIAWAANQYWPQVPALIVPDMVPTHGALNALGFVWCGHLACWLRWRLPPPSP